jgi:hypothetical protein
MPIPVVIPVKSDSYLDFTGNLEKCFFKKNILYSSAFFTLRASQSHRIGFVVARVRLGRLAIAHYSFMGHFLAAAAILTRE